MMFLINIPTAYGYGWGYKKTNDNKAPDVGTYGDLIKNHHAIYIDDSNDKDLYLTFDNGYEQGFTEQVLDILKEENVPATFFVTGHYVKTSPHIVERIAQEGHILGNHSYSHPDFTTMSKDAVEKELTKLEKAVAAVSEQKELKYLRPPRGTFNENTLKWADELGYIHVFWSLAFKDWEINKQKGWQYAYDQIMNQVHPGAILLLHAVSSDNADALKKVIIDLKKQGYQFKSLDDLLLKQTVLY